MSETCVTICCIPCSVLCCRPACSARFARTKLCCCVPCLFDESGQPRVLKYWCSGIDLDDLVEVMARTTGNERPSVQPVLTPDELARLRTIVRDVPIAPEVMRYAMRLVLATQAESPFAVDAARALLRYGASPRGAQTLVLGARAHALFHGRTHVTLADVRAVAHPALRHRIGLSFEAEDDGISADRLVESILDEVPEVVGKVARELRA